MNVKAFSCKKYVYNDVTIFFGAVHGMVKALARIAESRPADDVYDKTGMTE